MTAGTAQQTPTGASDGEVVADGVLRRIARQLAPYKRQMILVGLVVLLAAALTSVAPFLTPSSRSTGAR
jgi:ATP-binding cassette subfamily B protein